ncbi:hypothetical protein MTO96_030630 [Rhipicephalus appendiculatus]
MANKSPLLCTIKAPNRYGPYQHDDVVKQYVPNNTICDYIILDIAQSKDGDYNYTSYLFLSRKTQKYLFTINNNGSLAALQQLISGQKFVDSARLIRRVVNLLGFGLFEELSSIGSTYTSSEIAALKSIYKTLDDKMANDVGVQTAFNFYAVRPYDLQRNFNEYSEFMRNISG